MIGHLCVRAQKSVCGIWLTRRDPTVPGMDPRGEAGNIKNDSTPESKKNPDLKDFFISG
jgi:hypothetical protein